MPPKEEHAAEAAGSQATSGRKVRLTSLSSCAG